MSADGTMVMLSGASRRELDLGAQEVARALGRTLYRIDLHKIASKYIGETEKQIDRLFGEALASAAILYFDDGDALFGRGTSGSSDQDRATVQSARLVLERLASFRGVIVMLVSQPPAPSTQLRMKRRLHITFPARA